MVESNGPQSGGGFIATALIVLGAIWMLLTGLCTGGFAISSLFGGVTDISEILGVLSFVLGVGAMCFAPGLAIWLIGRALRRRGR